MKPDPSYSSDQAIGSAALKRSFDEFVKPNWERWLQFAKSVQGANFQDAEDGIQMALLALWKLVIDNAQPGDKCAEAVAKSALAQDGPGGSIDGWMFKVIHNKVTDHVRKMYALNLKKSKHDSAAAVEDEMEKKEGHESRRRSVQMKDEHLAMLEATPPDLSREWSEAKHAFLVNARKWLTEKERIALEAKGRLDPPAVTWEHLAVEVGAITPAGLKERAHRAFTKLQAKLAKLGFTNLGSV